MATIVSGTISIISNADDGELENTTLYISGENNLDYFGSYNSVGKLGWAWLRFKLPFDIPTGVTVQNSKLTVYKKTAYSWTDDVRALKIWVEDTSSASAPTLATQQPLSGSNAKSVLATTVRWPLAGNMTWTPINQWTDTPDVSNLVQELINTYGGLHQNDYIQFWLAAESMGPNNTWVSFADYSIGAASASQLYLEYSTSTPLTYIKSFTGIPIAHLKTINGIPIENIYSINGIKI